MKQFDLGPWKILPYPVMHDVKTHGFLLYHVPTKNKICFFTDTFYVPSTFKGLNNIIGEVNFSNEIIDKKLKEGSNKFVRDRVIQSHMELGVFQDFLKANDLSKVNNIALIHLSNSNSDEKYFKETIENQTAKKVTIMTDGLEIPLNITPF